MQLDVKLRFVLRKGGFDTCRERVGQIKGGQGRERCTGTEREREMEIEIDTWKERERHLFFSILFSILFFFFSFFYSFFVSSPFFFCFFSILLSSLLLTSLHFTSPLFLFLCLLRDGVPASILIEALDKAKTGRLQILAAMKISQPNMRKTVKDSAPKAKVNSKCIMSYSSRTTSLSRSLILPLSLFLSLSQSLSLFFFLSLSLSLSLSHSHTHTHTHSLFL